MVGVSISKFFLRSQPQEIGHTTEIFLHSTSTLAVAAAATSNLYNTDSTLSPTFKHNITHKYKNIYF